MTDWSKCPAVESIPGKVSGNWVVYRHPFCRYTPFSRTLLRVRPSTTSSSGSEEWMKRR